MMQPLSAAAMLAVWEDNWRRPPPWQGLALLDAACPDETRDSLLAMSVGRCHERLLLLHQWHFGASMTAVTTCTGCGELIEVTLDVAALRTQQTEAPPAWQELADASDVRFRVPALEDLIAAGDAATVDEAAQLLLQRCLENPDVSLAPEAYAAVTAAMEHADPLAVIELGGACPHCDQPWSAFLDVASFLWREVQNWAQRTLQEVHILARAYGWREAEILEMTAVRRQAYLQMVYG